MSCDKLLCWKCRKLVPYSVYSRKRIRTVFDKKYEYTERYGKCDICHEEITVPGLDDENEQVFDAILRSENNLITVNEIEDILKKYNIEKRPLSHALGLGEHTISRYLDGALPQKKYSDLLRRIYIYHSLMSDYLEKNRKDITDNAYNKAHKAIETIEKMSSYEKKTELISLYLIHKGYEVTNLSLQKLLYYTKGFSKIILKKDIVDDVCEAWGYGPVFPDIYDKYKSFGKETIPDFDVTINYPELLSGKEIDLLDYVIDCFGIYNGITLMKLTHKEKPWLDAREGMPEYITSRNIIKNETIYKYFAEMDSKYNFHDAKGVERYIRDLR